MGGLTAWSAGPFFCFVLVGEDSWAFDPTFEQQTGPCWWVCSILYAALDRTRYGGGVGGGVV